MLRADTTALTLSKKTFSLNRRLNMSMNIKLSFPGSQDICLDWFNHPSLNIVKLSLTLYLLHLWQRPGHVGAVVVVLVRLSGGARVSISTYVGVGDGDRHVSTGSPHHLVSLVTNNSQGLPLELINDLLVQGDGVHHGPVHLAVLTVDHWRVRIKVLNILTGNMRC